MPGDPIDKVVDRLVKFDLPFPLLLPDSLKLPEDDRDPNAFADEVFVAGDPPGGVRVAIRANDRADIVSRGVLEGGDPYGRVTYTRIQVRFNASASPSILEWSDDDLIDGTLGVVNRLIEVYRDVAHQPVLRHVVRQHIVHFLVMDGLEGGDIRTRAVSRASGPLRVGIGDEEQQVDKALRARLQSTDPIEFTRELYLDAQSRLATQDYRLAVIEAEILFEAWLSRYLAEHLRREGTSEKDLRVQFTHKNGRPRSVTNLVTTVFKDITGFDFSSTPECQRWKDDARNIRNELVHGERRDVTEVEARRALVAVTKANEVLKRGAPLPPGST